MSKMSNVKNLAFNFVVGTSARGRLFRAVGLAILIVLGLGSQPEVRDGVSNAANTSKETISNGVNSASNFVGSLVNGDDTGVASDSEQSSADVPDESVIIDTVSEAASASSATTSE